MIETSPGALRTVTAHFDDARKAKEAIAWLRNTGLAAEQIQLETIAGQVPTVPSAQTQKGRRGFMDSLVGLVFRDGEDDEAAAGFPCKVTVTKLDARLFDMVVSILNQEGKVIFDLARPAPAQAATATPAAATPVDHSAPTVQAVAQAPARAAPPAPEPDIAGASRIKGFIGACLVDTDSGLMLASEGGGTLDLDLVAALNTNAVKAEQNAIHELGLDQRIEDITITLEKQVHLIRPLERNRSMFVYVALDKSTSNLGMARIQLRNLEASMAI